MVTVGMPRTFVRPDVDAPMDDGEPAAGVGARPDRELRSAASEPRRARAARPPHRWDATAQGRRAPRPSRIVPRWLGRRCGRRRRGRGRPTLRWRTECGSFGGHAGGQGLTAAPRAVLLAAESGDRQVGGGQCAPQRPSVSAGRVVRPRSPSGARFAADWPAAYPAPDDAWSACRWRKGNCPPRRGRPHRGGHAGQVAREPPLALGLVDRRRCSPRAGAVRCDRRRPRGSSAGTAVSGPSGVAASMACVAWSDRTPSALRTWSTSDW